MHKTLLLLTAISFFSVAADQDQQCFTLQECTNYVHTKLVKNLKVTDSHYGEVVVIEFFLNDYAEIIEQTITTASGNEDLSQSIAQAVKSSSPFSGLRGLSAEDYKEFKHIKLTVDLRLP